MKRFLFITVLVLNFVSLRAQEAEEPRPVQFYALGMSNGAAWINESPAGLAELKKLAPGMTMLQHDFSGFDPNGFYFPEIAFAYGFTSEWRHIKWRSARFRAGISVNDMSAMPVDFYRTETSVIGSGTTVNGYPYQIDSIINEQYMFRWNYRQAGLSFDYRFQTRETRRISVWAGAGVLVSLAFNNYVEGIYSKFTRTRLQLLSTASNSNATLTSDSESSEEIMRLQNTTAFRLYIPFGAQIVLSKRRRILSHLYYTTEFIRGIEFMPMKETGTHVRSFSSFQTGFRYVIPTLFPKNSGIPSYPRNGF